MVDGDITQTEESYGKQSHVHTERNKTQLNKSRVIVGNRPNKQVLVKIDDSRHMTLRNRRFVQQILPPVDARYSQHLQQVPQTKEQPTISAELNPPLHHQLLLQAHQYVGEIAETTFAQDV